MGPDIGTIAIAIVPTFIAVPWLPASSRYRKNRLKALNTFEFDADG
jgi:hypothetical protein